MKTWQKWLVKICKLKGTLDTEKLIREKNRRILELEQEVAELKSRLWHPGLVHVEINPVLKAQAQAQISTYEPPQKRTDPAQFGIRRRAMTRQLQENHQLMHLHHEMLAKKAQAAIEPETVTLPSMVMPTAPEDDWTNGGIDQTTRHKAV